MKEFKDKYDELFKKYRGGNNEKTQEVSSEKVVEFTTKNADGQELSMPKTREELKEKNKLTDEELDELEELQYGSDSLNDFLLN
jgi:hypothetical protein